MHEISLIRSVIGSLDQEFTPDEIEKLSCIYLDIGVMSNVEPLLLQNAFDAVCLADKRYEKVKLEVNSIPVIIHCNACDSETEVQHYKFYCDNCGKPCNNVIKGTEMLIKKVEFID